MGNGVRAQTQPSAAEIIQAKLDEGQVVIITRRQHAGEHDKTKQGGPVAGLEHFKLGVQSWEEQKMTPG